MSTPAKPPRSFKRILNHLDIQTVRLETRLTYEFNLVKSCIEGVRNFGVRRLQLYGSIVHETFLPTSDIDAKLDVNFHRNSTLEDRKDILRSIFNIYDRRYYKEFRIVTLPRGMQLVTTRTPGDFLLNIIVNNPTSMPTTIFYTKLGRFNIFRDTSRILKLWSLNQVHRYDVDGNAAYPVGFFFDLLVAQQLFRDNNFKWEGNRLANRDVAILEKNCAADGYTVEKCLESCLNYLLDELKGMDKLVYDYSLRAYAGYEFTKKRHLKEFQEKCRAFREFVILNSVPCDYILILKGEKTRFWHQRNSLTIAQERRDQKKKKYSKNKEEDVEDEEEEEEDKEEETEVEEKKGFYSKKGRGRNPPGRRRQEEEEEEDDGYNDNDDGGYRTRNNYSYRRGNRGYRRGRGGRSRGRGRGRSGRYSRRGRYYSYRGYTSDSSNYGRGRRTDDKNNK